MISLKQHIKVHDILVLHPNLYLIITYAYQYAVTYELPFMITSLADEYSGRVSRSHIEGRACDLSVRGWSQFHIARLTNKINKQFKNIGAISLSDGVSRACVYHTMEGGAYHFHLQVRPGDKLYYDFEDS